MENNNINILTTADNAYFQVCIHEFVKSAKEEYDITTEQIANQHQFKLKILRNISKLIKVPKLTRTHSLNSIKNLSVQIGPDFAPIFKKSLQGGNNSMYLFDCWLANMPWVVELSRILNISNLFFSTKQACDAYNAQKKSIKCNAYWIPEGIYANDYKWRPWQEKNIDVLEFGRRYAKYHDLIKGPLAENNFNHQFAADNTLLFEDHSSFVDGLSRTKISICFPSDITHPERAGNVSTMTLRYLQSMASKCLIVGKLPYDMQFHFDYNPVVEIEEGREAEQIIDILNNFNQYIDLIERNYREVTLNLQWKNRIHQIVDILDERNNEF